MAVRNNHAETRKQEPGEGFVAEVAANADMPRTNEALHTPASQGNAFLGSTPWEISI